MRSRPLKLLLDENLRDRGLWAAITQHNAKSDEDLDVVRVGDADGPLLGILDPELIAWAAANGRILVGLDKSTLPSHLANFLNAGNQSPGVIFLRTDLTRNDVLELLILIAHASKSAEWANTYRWIP